MEKEGGERENDTKLEQKTSDKFEKPPAFYENKQGNF